MIGGGISAAQYALACARAGHRVTLLSRHPLRRAEFDGQPCFAGPRCLAPFLRLPMAQRPRVLAAARNPATLPSDVHAELTTQLDSGAIRWRCAEVTALADDGLRLAGGRHLAADHVVLATGFKAGAGALYEQTAARLQLPLDAHGYAHVDADLGWAPGLHACGRPASLQLGPMAGNIRGARLAGQRLARVAARGAGSKSTARHRA